ncbi:LysR family transcriptional regulator [Sinomonas sp. ASV322]|uniref:LysR family transcriptional regulator n=1 Tax=Sinomonas sp. ASV322 TaxID=3041920 RepID=UPI0027DD6017|nr:LysR family transcriptional regulator [Sinomonas sp. ASV322]MDQ4501211.1 LysR family transcriptional regulator [Sinomonas sp. ASV322]
MDLQQMRYVVAVAETRNFTRAAEQCFTVQSALSHQVANLEREIGVRLFARTSRRVEVTAAGEAFVAVARQCLSEADRAVAEAQAADGIVRGSLAVGMIPTVTAVDLPLVLRKYRKAHPDVTVTLEVGASDRMAEQIAAGAIDLAFLGLPEHEEPRDVAYRQLAAEALVAVVPETHALARQRRIRLDALAGAEFVDFPSGTPGRNQSDGAFQAAGLKRRVALEAMTVDLMLRLVSSDLAVALLPRGSVEGAPGVAILEVDDGPRRVEYVAWSEFNPSPAVRAFLATLGDAGSWGEAL